MDERTESAQEVVFHTAVNRLTGGALSGKLFTTIVQAPNNRNYEVHCTINLPFTVEKLNACLDFINHTGFGKKKSTGKGRVFCDLIETVAPKPDLKTNAFMTLSNYIPKTSAAANDLNHKNDPTDGYYKLLTKYGKLGGHFASSPVKDGAEVLPFKYPLILFSQGSVFRTSEGSRRDYGCIVRPIHPQLDTIAHYGLAYPYPLWIEA
jgi:CRISPR-associated protein Csm4